MIGEKTNYHTTVKVVKGIKFMRLVFNIIIVCLLIFASSVICFGQNRLIPDSRKDYTLSKSEIDLLNVQSNPLPKPEKEFCNLHCKISTGVMITGFTLDGISSRNKLELNPLLKTETGFYSGKKDILYKSIFTSVSLIIPQRNKKIVIMSRYIIGGIFIGVAIRDFRIEPYPEYLTKIKFGSGPAPYIPE